MREDREFLDQVRRSLLRISPWMPWLMQGDDHENLVMLSRGSHRACILDVSLLRSRATGGDMGPYVFESLHQSSMHHSSRERSQRDRRISLQRWHDLHSMQRQVLHLFFLSGMPHSMHDYCVQIHLEMLSEWGVPSRYRYSQHSHQPIRPSLLASWQVGYCIVISHASEWGEHQYEG